MEKNTNNIIGVFIMKKCVFVILIILFLFMAIPNEKEDLRIRVIANSDSIYDQGIKEKVVEIVKSVINANDTREKIKGKLPILKKEISKFLDPKKIEFTVSIKDEYFPKKSLNGNIIAEGYYEALVISIGKANGKNWWTLLYPEYFNISYDDIDSGELDTKFYFYEKIKKYIK